MGTSAQQKNELLNEIKQLKSEIKSLKKEKDMFQNIAESAIDNIAICSFDFKAKYLYVSPSTPKTVGYNPDEMIGKSFFNFLHPDDKKIIFTLLKKYLTQAIQSTFNFTDSSLKETLEYRFKHKNGSWRVLQSNVSFIGKNLLAISRDITDLKTKQKEINRVLHQIEESEQTFRDLFEKSGDAILIIENSRFVNCNNATIKMLKYKSKNEFLNTHPSELSPPYQPDGRDSVEKANEMMEIALQNGTHRFEWNHKKSDGKIFPVEVLLTAISNEPDKKVIHTVWRDITKRKKAEKHLKEALEKAKESDRLKSAFLANMSHEIRTPMNGILGFANLLKEKNLSGTEQHQYIEIIEKSGNRMLNIINDLIDISKVEAGQTELHITETNLNKQVEYIYTFFKPEVEKKDMQLFYHTPLPEHETNIYTDREKLYAILTNLVKNAIKYSDSGQIDIGYTKKNGFFEFYVRDTGMGIPKKLHRHIFDRFVQAEANESKIIEGAGLGLSISKAWTEMLGGVIWVDSQEGKGSTFYFTIPDKKNKSATNSVSQQKIETKTPAKKLKILIAEDENISFTLLNTILQKTGSKIFHAETGKEAVEIFKKNRDIDLILMDVKMPVMNGYEATKEIRKLDNDVIIFAQTAFAIAGDKEKALKSGCNDYISKPIKGEKLLQLISKYF